MRRSFLDRFPLARLDAQLAAWLLVLLAALVFTSARANLQTDAVDYYAMVQRLVGDAPPILPHLPFVDQRSPGYPLLTLPLYYALGVAEPLTEVQPVRPPPGAPQPGAAPSASEATLLPPWPLPLRHLFFKDFPLPPPAGVVRWRILVAMLLTGYALCFGGLWLSARMLGMLYPSLPGRSLLPLMMLTSPVFLHNLLQTPTYATLTAFGVACWAAYAWMLAWQTDSPRAQATSGAATGMLALVRLETAVFAAALGAGLAALRRWRFAAWYAAGGLVPLALLLAYNTAQFGNPWHAGALRGTMNVLTFRPDYMLSALVGPQAGLIWHSPLISLGIVGLVTGRSRDLRVLGWGALALVALILLRVPVMYFCIGEGTRIVEGVPITCPTDWDAMQRLIRLDINRYVIPLAPFAALGLRGLLARIHLLEVFSTHGATPLP